MIILCNGCGWCSRWDTYRASLSIPSARRLRRWQWAENYTKRTGFYAAKCSVCIACVCGWMLVFRGSLLPRADVVECAFFSRVSDGGAPKLCDMSRMEISRSHVSDSQPACCEKCLDSWNGFCKNFMQIMEKLQGFSPRSHSSRLSSKQRSLHRLFIIIYFFEFHPSFRYFSCHGSTPSLEIIRVEPRASWLKHPLNPCSPISSHNNPLAIIHGNL